MSNPLTPEDLVHRFAYHAPTGGKAKKHEAVRAACLEAALEIAVHCPNSRELSLAITKLEEAMMHANAAIARNPEV
jgi:hypothetical protein